MPQLPAEDQKLVAHRAVDELAVDGVQKGVPDGAERVAFIY
jgi:hypothetical protein